MAARKKTTRRRRQPVESDPVSARLEFLAGLMLLSPEAKEGEKIAIAARVGLESATIARIFNKKPSAVHMAVSRARKKS